MKGKEGKRRPAAWFVTTPLLALALGGLIGPNPGQSAVVVEEVPPALDAVNDLPPIPNLDKFIKNEVAAVRLGKALFWDMQAGSDGQACASCHFHAGADSRAKNQLTPGLNAGDVTFQPTASGNLGGPNYTLVPEDFPFHQKVNELDRALGNNVAFDTNDVASSQGVFNSDFIDVVPGDLKDDCAAVADDIFHIGINNTRRVEPRQTPTVINAALNFENFWDGRAKNNFNGVSPIGLRDDGARVWRNTASGLKQVTLKGNLELINASLASQAVGPPLSNFEMSCAGRTFPKIGKKLIPIKSLQFQQVHPQDSVLGPFSDPHGKGLKLTYEEMIKAAFSNQWWNAPDPVDLTDGQFTQMEANFSLFWGLSIMLYERTLVSDKAPFDDFRRGDPSALTAMQQRGLAVFMVQGKCVNCHATAAFTKASTLHLIPENQENGLVERMLMGDEDRGPALYDNGFYNIGVRPTTDDIARGAEIPLGVPLSFTRQYLDLLRGKHVPDPFQVNECTFAIRFDNPLNMSPLNLDVNGKVLTASGEAGDLDQNGVSDPFPVGFEFDPVECNNLDPLAPVTDTVKPRLPANAMRKALQRNTIANFRTAVDGAFKVPTLRNVNLTGPFMHNGGMATLWQVVSFYNRGGDFFEANEVNVDPDIVPLSLTLAQRVELVAFLNSLTDPRVTNEEDVYDHPQLFVANGGTTAETDVRDCMTELNPITGVEKCANAVVIPAVGIRGRAAENLPPLQPFQLSPTSGDLNHDGAVDNGDAGVLFAAFGKCRVDAGFNPAADFDTDSCITFVDYQIWYAIFAAQ